MGLSKGSILLVGAIAAVGFGAGATLVLLKQPNRVAAWNAPQTSAAAVATATTETTGASALDATVLAALQELDTNTAPEAVTRAENTDLLQVTPQAEPVAAPEAPRQVAVADTAQSAAFFDNAQANLVSQDTCRDDLQALAAGTRIYFPSGGLAASDAGLISARLIAKTVRDCPGYAVQVEGHSDPSGNPAINLQLSKKRAEAVIQRLASGGIDTSNLIAVGYGDTRPSGETGPQGDAFYDRRVEFSIVERTRQASLGVTALPWQTANTQQGSSCVQALQYQADATRIFYAARAITANSSDMQVAQNLARQVAQCDGVRLRIVGHFTDQPGARESVATGRHRALALMSALASSGVDSKRILVGAPSRSIGIAGQPGLPKSRVDFQIITD